MVDRIRRANQQGIRRRIKCRIAGGKMSLILDDRDVHVWHFYLHWVGVKREKKALQDTQKALF
jgi:hypothetical protein